MKRKHLERSMRSTLWIYLMVVCMALVSAGCNTNEPQHSSSEIVGHSYLVAMDGDYIRFLFKTNNVCEYTEQINGDYLWTDDMTYTIYGNYVRVYTNGSETWAEEYRNKLLYELIFQPATGELKYGDYFLKREK